MGRAPRRRGYTVRLPRLPGHGTTWQEMNRTRWQDWYAEVDAAFRELHERCAPRRSSAACRWAARSRLRLAQEHGPRVAGLVLVNPADASSRTGAWSLLPVLKHVVRLVPRDRQRHQEAGRHRARPTTGTPLQGRRTPRSRRGARHPRPARGHPAGAAAALAAGPRGARVELGAGAVAGSPARTSPRSCSRTVLPRGDARQRRADVIFEEESSTSSSG